MPQGEVTAGLGLRGRARGHHAGPGGGRGSRHDWAAVALETPRPPRVSSGQLDSGHPPWARGPRVLAVAAWTVPGRAQVHPPARATREHSRFGLKDRGSVAHLPSLDSGVPCVHGLEGTTAEPEG